MFKSGQTVPGWYTNPVKGTSGRMTFFGEAAHQSFGNRFIRVARTHGGPASRVQKGRDFTRPPPPPAPLCHPPHPPRARLAVLRDHQPAVESLRNARVTPRGRKSRKGETNAVRECCGSFAEPTRADSRAVPCGTVQHGWARL